MNKGINLIADKKKATLRPFVRRLTVLRFIAISLLFGVSVLSLVLFFLISSSPLPVTRTGTTRDSKFFPISAGSCKNSFGKGAGESY